LKIPLLIISVNNAAISNKEHPDDPACSVDLKEFQEVMKINVTGVLALTQAFIPLLKKSTKNPRVINIFIRGRKYLNFLKIFKYIIPDFQGSIKYVD